MKTFLTLILCFIIIQISFSQSIIINGKIGNFGSPIIRIDDYNVNVDSTGYFKLKLETNGPDIYTLRYHGDKTELFLQPSDSIYIQFDAQNFSSSITFFGANASIQKFLIDLFIKAKPVQDYFNNHWNDLITFSEDDYIDKINELKHQIIEPINDFCKSDNTSQWFNKYYRLNEELSFNRLIYIYPVVHYNYMSLENQLNFRKKHGYLETFSLTDAELLKCESYKLLMPEILRLDVQTYLINHPELRTSNNQWTTAYQKVIIEKFANDTIRDYWLHNNLYNHIGEMGVKDIDTLIMEFNTYCKNTTLKNEVNNYYQKEKKKQENHLIKTYKTIDGFNLDAHIFIPKDIKPQEKRPAILYFHGGGYSKGNPAWHCHYDGNGFIQISFEFRTYNRHGTMPPAATEDAKSAVRWSREFAKELHIDTNKIIVSGNSSGGAMAYMTALLDSLDSPYENLSISSKPNAMILNAAGYDQTDKFFPFEDKKTLTRISGINIVKPNAPPCLVIHGSADKDFPLPIVEEFVKKMRDAGNICELKVLEGAGHVPWLTPPYSTQAHKARQDFLRKIGYIE